MGQFVSQYFSKPFLIARKDRFFIQGHPDLRVGTIEWNREPVHDLILIR